MSDATEHAIREGVNAATKRVIGNDIDMYPVWMDEVVAEVKQRLPVHDELSDVMVTALDTEFKRRLHGELRDLVGSISFTADRAQPSALPDAIAEWGEVLDRIGTAVYHFVEDKNVLMGLHFITMTGRQWSDIIEAARDAEEEGYGGD